MQGEEGKTLLIALILEKPLISRPQAIENKMIAALLCNP
jgi:hypothetical protein